jgi:hypothetical protein
MDHYFSNQTMHLVASYFFIANIIPFVFMPVGIESDDSKYSIKVKKFVNSKSLFSSEDNILDYLADISINVGFPNLRELEIVSDIHVSVSAHPSVKATLAGFSSARALYLEIKFKLAQPNKLIRLSL